MNSKLKNKYTRYIYACTHVCATSKLWRHHYLYNVDFKTLVYLFSFSNLTESSVHVWNLQKSNIKKFWLCLQDVFFYKIKGASLMMWHLLTGHVQFFYGVINIQFDVIHKIYQSQYIANRTVLVFLSSHDHYSEFSKVCLHKPRHSLLH